MSIIATVLSGILSLLKEWILIFAAPLRNPDMLWIMVPIYISWFAAEFFQEKRGTSLGNAISNGVVPLWTSADWIRNLLRMKAAGEIALGISFAAKIIWAVIIFFYGLVIIIDGIKAKASTKVIGRIRVVTYVMIMFTPVFYNEVNITLRSLLAMVLFFPLYYAIVEIIDRIVPDPAAFKEDEKAEEQKVSASEARLDPGLSSIDTTFQPSTQNPAYPSGTPHAGQPFPPFTQSRFQQFPRQQ